MNQKYWIKMFKNQGWQEVRKTGKHIILEKEGMRILLNCHTNSEVSPGVKREYEKILKTSGKGNRVKKLIERK